MQVRHILFSMIYFRLPLFGFQLKEFKVNFFQDLLEEILKNIKFYFCLVQMLFKGGRRKKKKRGHRKKLAQSQGNI